MKNAILLLEVKSWNWNAISAVSFIVLTIAIIGVTIVQGKRQNKLQKYSLKITLYDRYSKVYLALHEACIFIKSIDWYVFMQIQIHSNDLIKKKLDKIDNALGEGMIGISILYENSDINNNLLLADSMWALFVVKTQLLCAQIHSLKDTDTEYVIENYSSYTSKDFNCPENMKRLIDKIPEIKKDVEEIDNLKKYFRKFETTTLPELKKYCQIPEIKS